MNFKAEAWTVESLCTEAWTGATNKGNNIFCSFSGPITRNNAVVEVTWSRAELWCLPVDLLLDALPGCVATYNTLHAAAADETLNVDAHLCVRRRGPARRAALFARMEPGYMFPVDFSLCFIASSPTHSIFALCFMRRSLLFRSCPGRHRGRRLAGRQRRHRCRVRYDALDMRRQRRGSTTLATHTLIGYRCGCVLDAAIAVAKACSDRTWLEFKKRLVGCNYPSMNDPVSIALCHPPWCACRSGPSRSCG